MFKWLFSSRLITVFIITQLLILFVLFHGMPERFKWSHSDKLIRSIHTRAPICLAQNEVTKSAIERTKSEYCQTLFRTIGCSDEHTKQTFISSECPLRKNLKLTPKSLGCHKISRYVMKDRLPGSTNASECSQLCFQSGVRYAVTTAQQACLCMKVQPTFHHSALPSFMCQTGKLCNASKEVSSNQSIMEPCDNNGAAFVVDTGAMAHSYMSIGKMTLTPQTEPVRIIYLLIWHGRGWRQMRRMFRWLFHPRHYYYIHVDSRNNYLYEQARQLADRYPENVHVTSKRWTPDWGATDLLWMVLAVMQELITQMTHWKWDFFINLSGNDMLIRPHQQLVKFLSAHRGKIFLRRSSNIPGFIISQSMHRLFVHCDQHMWNLGSRHLLSGLLIDGGSDWFVLPREFVDYVARTNDSVMLGLKEFAKYSLLPVEFYFHTLVQNTHFCQSVYDHSLRIISWDRPRGCECKQDKMVDACGCSPVALRGYKGVQKLCNYVGHCDPKSPHVSMDTAIFFARKFDPTVDLGIVNIVTSRVFGENSSSSAWDLYLENIYSAHFDRLSAPLAWRLGLPVMAKRMLHELVVSHFHKRLTLTLDDTFFDELQAFALFNATDQAAYNNLRVDVAPRMTSPRVVMQFPVYVYNSHVIRIELLVQPISFSWATPSPVANHSHGDVVFLKVTTLFDAKDQIIRNYPRLLTTQDNLEVVLFWKKSGPRSSENASFLLWLQSPQQELCLNAFTLHITRASRAQSAFNCNSCLLHISSIKPSILAGTQCHWISGWWNMTVQASSGQTVSVGFFLLASSSSASSSVGVVDTKDVFGKSLTTLTKFSESIVDWSPARLVAHCFHSIPVSLKKLYEWTECKDQVWSTLADDPKSRLPN